MKARRNGVVFFGGAMDATQIDERIERMLKHRYVEIDATPEQQQKLAPIVKQAARKQAIELMSAEHLQRRRGMAHRGVMHHW